MAQLIFNIPDEKLPRVINVLADRFKYQTQIEGIDPDTGQVTLMPNPQTKAQFVKNEISKLIKNLVVDWEVELAKQTARNTAETLDIT